MEITGKLTNFPCSKAVLGQMVYNSFAVVSFIWFFVSVCQVETIKNFGFNSFLPLRTHFSLRTEPIFLLLLVLPLSLKKVIASDYKHHTHTHTHAPYMNHMNICTQRYCSLGKISIKKSKRENKVRMYQVQAEEQQKEEEEEEEKTLCMAII